MKIVRTLLFGVVLGMLFCAAQASFAQAETDSEQGVSRSKKSDEKAAANKKKQEKKKAAKQEDVGPAGEKWRTYNVTMNPIGALFGFYSGTFNYGLTDSITVGIAAGYSSYSINTTLTSGTTTITSGTTMNAFNIGARANYYLQQRYSQNFYLGVEAGFAPFSLTIGTAKGNIGAVTMGALLGYAFMTEFGLNIMIGAGVKYSTTPSNAVLSDGKSYAVPAFTGVVPNLELNLGFAF